MQRLVWGSGILLVLTAVGFLLAQVNEDVAQGPPADAPGGAARRQGPPPDGPPGAPPRGKLGRGKLERGKLERGQFEHGKPDGEGPGPGPGPGGPGRREEGRRGPHGGGPGGGFGPGFDGPPPFAPPPPPPHPLETALDADQDGIISAKELENAAAALRKLDRNGDGQISEREYRPAPPHGPGPHGPGADGQPKPDRPKPDTGAAV